MPYAADGSPHHSLSRVRMHEEKSAKPKPKAEESEPKKPMAEENSSGEDIKQVVAEHGPASEMHYKKDEATGKHHVHSKHGAKDHHSEHDSPEEAMDQMKQASGAADEDEPADEELGEEAGEAMPEMQSAHHIPGL